MKREFISSSSGQTKKLGQKLAKEILRNKLKRRAPKESKHPTGQAFVIGLTGELGGGKTTFLQGFARGLGIKEKILSPTFVIMKRFKNFYHIDCYRIQKPEELLDLGFKEIISNPKNIVAIEWADKIRKIMPEDTIWINFEFIDEKTRRITFH